MAPGEQPAQLEHAVIRVRDDGARVSADDVLAVEEPLAIRLCWAVDGRRHCQGIAITMRTPGDDAALSAGFLRGEGIIASRDDLAAIETGSDDPALGQQNVVTVTLRTGLVPDLARLERHFYTSSSCGMCGKAALDALDRLGGGVLPPGPRVRATVIRALPQALRRAQAVFHATGGLHAAGLFELDGGLQALREDVGRHNALDKLIGQQLLAGRERLDDCVLLLSGRASFELLQKALLAGIPIVAAVGAPSSLAVRLAASYNLTLLGFVRPDGFNIYTGAERVDS